MKRVEALIKPELLVWARESAGLTPAEAARKVRVKEERLTSWEQGEHRPTINQLRGLGRVYKRPLAVFYLPEPPKDFQAMHDFRRLPGDVAGPESPALRLEIRKARYRRDVASALLKALGQKPPDLTVQGELREDPEELARKARTVLGVSYQEQSDWQNPYDALNGWRNALETLGILVFQASGVAVSEMRGFSLSETALPVIVVNAKDHPHGRIFSMFHEFAHLMLRREGLCDLVEDGRRPPEEQRVEVFCNHVAGAVLMPSDMLLEEEIVQARRVENWSAEELGKLAKTYRVSREALLRRLVILGKASEDFYREKREQFLNEIARREAKADGFAPPYRKAISSAGKTFVRLVLDSFYQEKITSSDVSDYLEVRLKWMPKIEEAVFGNKRDVWALA